VPVQTHLSHLSNSVRIDTVAMTPLLDSVALAAEKQALRRRIEALRLVADQKDGPDAARAIMHHFVANLDALGIHPGMIVSGYWPMSTEIDVRPLLARLEQHQVICALPVVHSRNQPLIFRRWHPCDALENGVFETMHPLAGAPEVRPDVVIAPLLAVDREGYRLGQGGAYYDRTLSALRRQGPVVVVGVGYRVQFVERVPRGNLDQKVDWILTDAGLVRATTDAGTKDGTP
jgi:5-formyltetrahydrofolate cyclo-ligase